MWQACVHILVPYSASASSIVMTPTNQLNDMHTFVAQTRTHSHTHTQDITAHQTAIPHLLLSKSQTAGWGCRSGHSRLTSPPRACLTQICSSPLSLSPRVLREKDLQAAVGWRWGRCRPLELMGGPGGMTWLLFWFPCPVARSCHTPASNTHDNSGEGALSICSPDTKTHILHHREPRQVLWMDTHIYNERLCLWNRRWCMRPCVWHNGWRM